MAGRVIQELLQPEFALPFRRIAAIADNIRLQNRRQRVWENHHQQDSDIPNFRCPEPIPALLPNPNRVFFLLEAVFFPTGIFIAT